MYQIWQIVRALQRAHVFAARKVHWTLRLSGSALYSSRLLVAVRLIWRIKSTGLYALSQITL
ncbi:hypothetical protein CYJ69_00795 [Gardnerella pickettii]|nr:hypothetical protein CYJ69_00795 [Gardnerella pickettii]